MEVIESKARPKKVKFVGSDGISRLFLCKFESSGDMRKEARIAVFVQLVNKLLRKNPKASELDLQLPSFCLLAISPACAVIEWVPETTTLRGIITKLWRLKGFNFDITQLDKGQKASSSKAWDYVQDRIRPQFHRHFYSTCPDGNSWHETRLRFTRSLAAWSMFGYIIGLGDRHCDNILMTNTGDLIFIDFDCVFDMGRTLKVPEMVPFRLTPELRDGLGIYGESGEFLHSCEVMLAALKEMSTELSSAFEPFIHDPLIIPIRNPELSRTDNDINNTLSIVVSRLKGQKSASEAILYPNTRLQVLDLVAKAKHEETLRKMFIGWMAWM
jgi:serine/threonine-protein kinase ATR